MVETRPDRHGLVQWSSGSDSGSRLDFNEAFAKLNAQAAYDDGDTLATLPVTNLVDARYSLVAITGGYRTLYRRSDTSTWDPIGGNTMPRAFTHRALEGQARTDTALTISHPDSASPGATIDYGGSALLTGTVRIHDANDVARGVLMIGSAAAIGLTTLGRMYVRTRATGERGIVVQAYTPVDPDVGSGNLFTALSPGGSEALSVDALGRLRGLVPAAFGGGALGTSAVVVAPTTSADDGQVNGLLLYGQATAATKTILRVLRQADDANAILSVGRDGMSVGRLPWTASRTTGLLTVAANSTLFRASGEGDNTGWWSFRTSDPADETNTALDKSQFSIGPAGIGTRLPLFITNRNLLAPTSVTISRVTNFTGPFLDLTRLVPDGIGGETVQVATTWDSDGRLKSGAWWKSVGTIRDARQSLIHVQRKRFTPLNGGILTGRFVQRDTSNTYDWTAIVVKSSGVTDLDIMITGEYMMTQNGDGKTDANSVQIDTYMSINGGAFALIEGDETASISSQNTHRESGDTLTVNHQVANVPNGASIVFRTRISIGDQNPSIWVRSYRMRVQECILESYTAP